MLFVKKRGGNIQNYAKILKLKIEESEELRIIYVAITRPRKVLIVVVPKRDKKVWERKFFNDEDQNERGKN